MPVTAPPVVGAYLTVRVTAWLGFSVTGNVAPDTVKPVPVIPAELTVTAVVPVEVSVTGRVALEPSITSPKVRLLGLTVSTSEVVPVPLKLTEVVGFVDEVLLIVNVPVTDPAVVGANFTVSVNVCLGFSVTGKVDPDTVKPVPLIVAELTFTAAVPLDVSVTVCVGADPTATLPKVRLLGLTVSTSEVVPVPLRLTVAVGFVDEVLLIVNAPVTAPAVVGANLTVSVSVCLGFSVTGKVDPDTVKPVPLMLAELTFTAAVPLEVSVTVCVGDDPTATLPKVRLLGLTVSRVDVVPVPLKLTEVVGFVDDVLLIVNAPVTAPAVVGANFTVSVSVCLGFSVTGKVDPETEKPEPPIVAELTFTAAVPLDVSVTVCVGLDPTATLPKLKLLGLTVNTGEFVPLPLRLTSIS